jgi:hypothetical protein
VRRSPLVGVYIAVAACQPTVAFTLAWVATSPRWEVPSPASVTDEMGVPLNNADRTSN